ncbi:MAG: RNA polymerase factor sigma-54 [Megasphaera elsdenii]|nr:RNA polymerase factor sigma-54 [Megasphaera elsdenii]
MSNLSLKLEQKAKILQVQRLTIQMLALHGQDLVDFLQEKVTANPLMDICYHDVRADEEKGRKAIENVHNHGASLEAKLMAQLRVQTLPKPVMLAAGLVIGSLDAKGFFQGDLASLGRAYQLGPADMEKGLALVQSFDPPGIAARDLRETLLIQTRRSRKAPAKTEALLAQHYEDFLQGKWQKIQVSLALSEADLQAIRDFLKTLSLQPAVQITQEEVYIRPDVEIYCDEKGQLALRSLEEIPDVYFRDDLYDQYAAQGDKETLAYIRKARRDFNDLASALAYRHHSIEQVVTCLMNHQKDYFLYHKPLQPLRQKDIAGETKLSTATVSRVCRHRYVLFEGQVYPLQSFLATAYAVDKEEGASVSDKAIMRKIADLVESEDKRHPYSDQDLSEYFANAQISVARRTITKFRQKLNIPNSRIRRRWRP